MAMLENVFSWSKSRDEQFRECRRRYYYDKYLAWGGWDTKAPKETRLAYILKNLKNRWAWKGETVHHLIEDVLKSMRAGKPVKPEEALARLTTVMREDYRSSKAKKYLQEPKKSVGLFEHEYEKPIADAVWKSIHDEAVACLKNFFDSSLFEELRRDDTKNWLIIEDLEEFDFEGSKIFVKLDFARKKDDRIEILDWKTGRSDASADASVQLGAYALYAMARWKWPLERIGTYLVNVSEPPVFAHCQPLSPELLESSKAFMRESIAAMKSVLSDPARNAPKGLDSFPPTENRRLCDFCSFAKICTR